VSAGAHHARLDRRAWISHDIPGRVRLRLPPGVDTDGLSAALARVPGVKACSWSPRTRGLLVRYRQDEVTLETITGVIAEESGVTLGEPLSPRTVDTPVDVRPSPIVSAAATTFNELNEEIRRRTRGTLTLGTLLPVALGAWAVLELVRGRAAPLAWSSALWYAHGLFRDYNTPAPDA
jgi:hypothetical protein